MKCVIDYMDKDPSRTNTGFRILYCNWTAGLDCFLNQSKMSPIMSEKKMKHSPINYKLKAN